MSFNVSGYIEQTGRADLGSVPHNATVCIKLDCAQIPLSQLRLPGDR